VDTSIRRIFDTAISYWPKEIDVGDKKIHQNGGAAIPNLTVIHDDIESAMLSANLSNAILHMDWAIYTVLHQMARHTDTIKPHEVDIKRVDAMYIENQKG